MSSTLSSSPLLPAAGWDGEYQNTEGVSVRYRHYRARLGPDVHIQLIFTDRAEGGYDITIRTPDLPPSTTPLTGEEVEKVKFALIKIREELAACATRQDWEVADVLEYVTRAVQLRLNQHYRAMKRDTVLSMDALMGLLTIEDEGTAESQMLELMESLKVETSHHGVGSGVNGNMASSSTDSDPPPPYTEYAEVSEGAIIKREDDDVPIKEEEEGDAFL